MSNHSNQNFPEENAPLLNSNQTPNDPSEVETESGHLSPDGGRTGSGTSIPRGHPRRRTESNYPSPRKFSQLELLLASICVLLLITTSIFAGLYARGKSNKHQGDKLPPEPLPSPPPMKNETEPGPCQTPDCVLTAAAIIQDIDLKHDPCQDFYQYSCGKWLDKNIIPDEKSRYSYFDNLYENNQKVLKGILESNSIPTDHIKPPTLPSPSETQDKLNFFKLQSLYKSCMNDTLIKELGVAPLTPILERIRQKFPRRKEGSLSYFLKRQTSSKKHDEKIANPKMLSTSIDKTNLTETLGYLNRIGVEPLFEFSIEADAKAPETNALYLSQSGLGLPSKEYYEEENILKVYKSVVAELLEKALGKEEADPKNAGSIRGAGIEKYFKEEWGQVADRIVEFERKLANISLSPEEFSDPEATYNPHSIPSLDVLSPIILWPQLIEALLPRAADFPTKVILTSNSYFERLSELVEQTPASTLEDYFLWQTISVYAEHLNEEFRAPLRRLAAKIQGVDETVLPKRWEVCLKIIDERMGYMAGRFYVLKTFGGDSKKISEKVISSVKQAFIKRLPYLEWLDEETREKAIKKVNTIIQKVGYPAKTPNTMDPISLAEYYEKLEIDETKYFKNIVNGYTWTTEKNWRKTGKPVNRDEWQMTPHTVNAYYNPTVNEIVFPAGILQPPFFSARHPEYVNYGAIGMVIGHELTHAFDNNGRQYDETGRLTQWWSNSTIKAFKNKTECFVNQYANYTIDGPEGEEVHLNGKLTLGENLADNGGIKAAYDAWLANYQADPEQKVHKNYDLPGLDDLTKEQIFYISFARVWCQKIRPESAKEKIRTDPHSPARWRVIGALQNSKHFAETFKCKPGTPMNPLDKCQLW